MIAAMIIASFAGVLAVLLLRGRADRTLQLMVALALGGGLLGYGLTGSPMLPARPAEPAALDLRSSAFETERADRLGRFGTAGAWLTFGDALLRADAGAMAVRGLRGAIDDRPRDPDLWIGLGNALAMHGGRVGAASRLAFDRAAQLAPNSPQPAFFRGLAELETGDARAAALTWRRLQARSLPDPTLDRWIAEAERRGGGQ